MTRLLRYPFVVRTLAVMLGVLAFLATPGVARADDLGAIGKGAGVLLVLTIGVVAFFLLLIVAGIAAVLGAKGSPQTPLRRMFAGWCLGLSLITSLGTTALFLMLIADEPGSVLAPMLVTVFVAVLVAAGPIWLSQRARRYQAEGPE